jgi:hypothetical protein
VAEERASSGEFPVAGFGFGDLLVFCPPPYADIHLGRGLAVLAATSRVVNRAGSLCKSAVQSRRGLMFPVRWWPQESRTYRCVGLMAEDNPMVLVVVGDEDLFVVHMTCSRQREQIMHGSSLERPLCPDERKSAGGQQGIGFSEGCPCASLTQSSFR